MAKTTSKFVMLPWLKGLDTDTDEALLQTLRKTDYLTQADDIKYDLDGSKVKRDGFTYHDSAAITGANTIIGGFDYWANVSNVKTQKIVVWDNQATGKCWFVAGAGGAWTELTKDATATAPTTLTRVSFEVFNDDLVMAFTDSNSAGRAPVKWDNQSGTAYLPLGGNPPKLKYIRKHQGRLWGAGDPTRPDRLYFTSPGNHEEWSGTGDSGAIDIDPGDGDVSGITAIFPSFRGTLFVAKQNSIYKITGTTPVDYKVEPVTFGLGCISHNSCVAVDMDDIYFASERGFHSIVLTDKFGDYEGAFLSKDVQGDFQDLDDSLNAFIQGVWIPSLNSVIWNVSRNGTRMDRLWCYDIRFKAWYRWTGVNPTCLFRVEDSSTKIKKPYFGNNAGRLSKTAAGIYHDYTSTAISQIAKTPWMSPSGDPTQVHGFKKLGVWMKMAAGGTLTVTAQLSNSNATQTLSFDSTAAGLPTLDVDFILGEDVLNAGGTERMTLYQLPFDGFAKSVQLTFTQATADKVCSIFGFFIEWEPAGDEQELIT